MCAWSFLLTCAGLLVIVEFVSIITEAVKAVENANTLVLTAIISKRTVVDHWNKATKTTDLLFTH